MQTVTLVLNKQDTAFEITKNILQTHSLFIRYDDSKHLVLTCDGSSYRIGAILSHTMKDSTDHLVDHLCFINFNSC